MTGVLARRRRTEMQKLNEKVQQRWMQGGDCDDESAAAARRRSARPAQLPPPVPAPRCSPPGLSHSQGPGAGAHPPTGALCALNSTRLLQLRQINGELRRQREAQESILSAVGLGAAEAGLEPGGQLAPPPAGDASATGGGGGEGEGDDGGEGGAGSGIQVGAAPKEWMCLSAVRRCRCVCQRCRKLGVGGVGCVGAGGQADLAGWPHWR